MGVLTVSVPVWSDINGQDDLVWYTATKQVNGTYKVSVKASDHKIHEASTTFTFITTN